MPPEEVSLRIKASPACLEREDHIATASNGVCHIQIRLFVRQGRHGPVGILLYVDDLVLANVDLDEIGRVNSQLAASFDIHEGPGGPSLLPRDRSDPRP